MIVALIKAGGIGSRLGAGIPKQFVLINDKPIIIYTMEQFQNHSEVDEIVVICVEGWMEKLRMYANKFGISKLSNIVCGGETSLKSIRNGVGALSDKYDDDDIILVHDGNRPLISKDIITDAIRQCQLNGSAVAAIPCTDEIMVKNDSFLGAEVYLDHKTLYRIQTPDAYKLFRLRKIFKNATEAQLQNIGATNVLMIDSGEKVFFSKGSELNIRLTTKEDMTMCKALLQIEGRI